jgi:hypothetical protein
MALFKCAKNNGYDIIKAEPSERVNGGTKYTLRNGNKLYFGPGQEPVPCTNLGDCSSCNGTGHWAFMNTIDLTGIPLGRIQAENA